MLVACLGAPAHPAARALYYDVGFRPFTRDLPHVKSGVAPTSARPGVAIAGAAWGVRS
jgi:hypothetical protein